MRISAVVSIVSTAFFSVCVRAEAVCFAPNAKPSIAIMQNAPPPKKADAADYPFYPASVIASMNLDALAASDAPIPTYFLQWGNHGPRKVHKPNLGPRISLQSRAKLDFSSPAAADACTLAQTAAVLGIDDAARRYADEGGIELTTTEPTEPTVDVCVLWDTRLPARAEGVLLDYEVQDGHSPSHTKAFLLKFAELVHGAGKKAILYTNPLDAPTQRHTGVDASNAQDLARVFDRMSIMLWSRNRQQSIAESFRSQMEILGHADPKKLMIVFELADTTMEDARTVRALAVENSIDLIALWRNLSRQGGSCDTPVNRKIACLAFGECPKAIR